jgi:hypothetical protein
VPHCRLILGLLLVLSTPALATTYLVRPDGTGDFPTIQTAIHVAFPGDIIELADGTFTGDGNRDIDFLGKPITVRSQSGDRDACIIDCQGSFEEYHRGFLFIAGEGPESILEGITIRNGGEFGFGGLNRLPDSRRTEPCPQFINDRRPAAGRSSNSAGGAIYCAGAGPIMRRYRS